MLDMISTEIRKTRQLMECIEHDALLLKTIKHVAESCIAALRSGRKMLFMGNGGSAADAQHLAAELVGRLRFDRPALAAIALTTDTSALTAIANDYAYQEIFVRQVAAIAQKGDVIIGISTSGNSLNVLKALEKARQLGLTTIGLTGQSAPLMADCCDIVLNVPSTETSKIQECHIMMGHIICMLIEEEMFGSLKMQVNIPHSQQVAQ